MIGAYQWTNVLHRINLISPFQRLFLRGCCCLIAEDECRSVLISPCGFRDGARVRKEYLLISLISIHDEHSIVPTVHKPHIPIVTFIANATDASPLTLLVFQEIKANKVAAMVIGTRRGWEGTESSLEGIGGFMDGSCQ
jgi:hypothetical protein